VCPSNCSGKGVCDYSLEVPSCVCFNKADRSASCDGKSPPVTQQPSLLPTLKPSQNPSTLPTPFVTFFKNVTMNQTELSSIDNTSLVISSSNAPSTSFLSSSVFFSVGSGSSANFSAHNTSITPENHINASESSTTTETTSNQGDFILDHSVEMLSSSLLLAPQMFSLISLGMITLLFLSV